MRKTIFLSLALLLTLGLCTSGAWGYDILNNTTIQDNTNSWISFLNGLPWNARTNPIDVLGDGNFSTKGADWNAATRTLTIYSNWGPGKNGFAPGVFTADLLIDVNCDGIWDFSVGLDDGTKGGLNRKGNIYTGVDQFTSAPAGYIYGVNFNVAAPRPIVDYEPNLESGVVVPVVWTSPGNAEAAYKVDVTLGNLVPDTGEWCFLWASGTCGNGPIEACVPLPPSVLLMGSGLLGLCILRFRRKNSA